MIDIGQIISDTLPGAIVLGGLSWPAKTSWSLFIMRRKIVTSDRNCDICQALHKKLGRLIANPNNRFLQEDVDRLTKKLLQKRGRREWTYFEKVKKALAERWEPSIRKSMLEYEKERSYEECSRLKAGLCPVLFRPATSPFESLELKWQYEFTKDCTQELAWLYVFHCNQAKDFMERSPILKILPYSVRKWVHKF